MQKYMKFFKFQASTMKKNFFLKMQHYKKMFVDALVFTRGVQVVIKRNIHCNKKVKN